jgi:hypothetical protein
LTQRRPFRLRRSRKNGETPAEDSFLKIRIPALV